MTALKINEIYQHYKGKRYKVIAVAKHSETLEDLIVYQALYGSRTVWVRPMEMFLGDVLVDDVSRPRFRLLSDPVDSELAKHD